MAGYVISLLTGRTCTSGEEFDGLNMRILRCLSSYFKVYHNALFVVSLNRDRRLVCLSTTKARQSLRRKRHKHKNKNDSVLGSSRSLGIISSMDTAPTGQLASIINRKRSTASLWRKGKHLRYVVQLLLIVIQVRYLSIFCHLPAQNKQRIPTHDCEGNPF